MNDDNVKNINNILSDECYHITIDCANFQPMQWMIMSVC